MTRRNGESRKPDSSRLHEWSGPHGKLLTLSVLDNLGGVTFHDRDAGVRRAQIDTDGGRLLRHIE